MQSLDVGSLRALESLSCTPEVSWVCLPAFCLFFQKGLTKVCLWDILGSFWHIQGLKRLHAEAFEALKAFDTRSLPQSEASDSAQILGDFEARWFQLQFAGSRLARSFERTHLWWLLQPTLGVLGRVPPKSHVRPCLQPKLLGSFVASHVGDLNLGGRVQSKFQGEDWQSLFVL